MSTGTVTPAAAASEPTASAGQAVDSQSRVTRYVLVLVAAAALIVAGALWSLAQLPAAVLLDPLLVVSVGILLAAFVLLNRYAFHLEWRGHRLVAGLDDAAVFLAFIALPPAIVVIALPVAGLIMHVWSGREAIKGAFNVAHDAIAVAVAWAAFSLAMTFAWPPLAAAALAMPAYVFTSHWQVAGVFSRLANLPTWRVFWDRFLTGATFLTALAAGLGTTVYALWMLHPSAILALTTFAVVARRYGVLISQSDRVRSVHQRLGSATHDLLGTSDLDTVADRVLDTCGALLLTGRVTLRLHGNNGTPAGEWSRDFTGGPASGNAALVMDLPGRDGTPLGTLTAHPRPAMGGFDEADAEIVRIMAGTAAHAVESARILQSLEDAREEALRTNEILARQEKLSALGTLVASVAHEIGNPLTYMKGNLELAAVTANGLADLGGAAAEQGVLLKEDLERAIEGVHRLQELTQNLKDRARKGTADRKDADLNAIANEVAATVTSGLPRNVHLDVALAEEPIPVRVNPGEITQVMLNLVKNAAEAIGEEEGHVTLRLGVAEGHATVRVSDDGPGIPEDLQAQLFEQFFTTKEKGTGLGLNISRRIAEKHGGDLTFESAVGQGTTFTLTLPVRAADAHPPDAPAA